MLRKPAFLTYFSKKFEIRFNKFKAVKTLTCFEPGLILSAILRRVYNVVFAVNITVKPKPNNYVIDEYIKEYDLIIIINFVNIILKFKSFRYYLLTLFRLVYIFLNRNDVIINKVYLYFVYNIIYYLL